MRCASNGEPRSKQAAEAYRELLLAFPIALKRHGLRFTQEPGSDLGPAYPGAVATIEQHLWEEIEAAVLSGSAEVASVASRLAFRVAADAAPLGATELVKRMLNLLAAEYWFAAGSADSRLRSSVTSSCVTTVFEFLRFCVMPQAWEAAFQQLPWDEAVRLVVVCFEEVGDLLKMAVDRGSPDDTHAIDDRWSDLFQLWRPDIEGPSEDFVALRVAQLGDRSPEAETYRQALQTSRRQTALIKGLTDQQATCRFDLAAWQLRRLRRLESATAEVEVFRQLAAHFTDIERVLAAAEAAFGATLTPNGGRLQQWVWSETAAKALGYGPRPSVGTEGYLTDCFLVLLLLNTNPDSGTPPFEAGEWLALRLDVLRNALANLQRLSELWTKLGVDRLDAARRARQGSSEPDRVETKRRGGARARSRFAGPGSSFPVSRASPPARGKPAEWPQCCSVDAGALVLDGQLPPDGTEHCLVRATVPKGVFIARLGYANDSFITLELGRAAANGEMSDLIARLMTAPEFRSAGSPAEVVRAAISALRDDEYAPSLLVTPYDWRLVEELALEERSSDEPASGFPEGARHWFKGAVAGVPVLTWPRELTDVAVLIDIPRFGRWRQWASTDGETLGVEVIFRNEAEAIALATADGSIGSDETHTSVPQRALKLRCEAVVQLSVHQTIEILESPSRAVESFCATLAPAESTIHPKMGSAAMTQLGPRIDDEPPIIASTAPTPPRLHRGLTGDRPN